MTKTVLHNQSLFDFVLHHCGCLNSLLLVASVNNISITAVLVPGQTLEIPNDAIVDNDIKNYYTIKNIIPAGDLVVKNNNNYQGPKNTNRCS